MKKSLRFLLYRMILYFNKKSDSFRLGYYKFLFGDKLILGNNILVRRGFSIVFMDYDQKASLHVGNNVELRQNCILALVGGGKIKIGEGVFFNNSCSITSLGEIKIGDNTLFGEGVKIYDHNHIYRNSGLIRNQGFTIGKVSIGENCWIGSNCVILSNVIIGDNVIIGANNLIYKSIPDNTIVIANASYSSRLME